MEFSNNTVDLDLLPKYEETKLQPLQPDYWKVIVINLVFFLLAIAICIAVVVWLKEETKPHLWKIIVLYIKFACGLFLTYYLSYKRRGVAVREKDIIYRSGILSVSTTIIPFVRIQHVALKEGFISRSYNLATLEVFTAGGATGNLNIPGLKIDEAKKIKELLLNKLEENA